MPRNALAVVARYWVICFVFALFPFGLPAVLAGVLSLPFLAFVALLAAVYFNGIQGLGHKLLFGGTRDYEELRAKGLDAWFDVSCPWPFRSESSSIHSLTTNHRFASSATIAGQRHSILNCPVRRVATSSSNAPGVLLP